MGSFEGLRPGGSGILPEETPPKFFARHLSAYYFALPYIKEKDVLEIGFGDGYGAELLARHAKSIKAIDELKRNVELASAKYKRSNMEFREMSAINLSFGAETFDAVVSFQVVEHIAEDNLTDYLGEIRRVLKRDGVAFISTLNLEKNKKPGRPYNKNPFHIREFAYEQFDSLIGSGFDDYDIHGLFYGPRLKFYERLKKIGIPVNRFYNSITVREFVWRKKNIGQCIDFMAVCRKR